MRTPLDLLSSPLFPLFFPAQENAISYYDSKADSDYVSTVRTAPDLPPACLSKHPRPPYKPYPLYPPPFTLLPRLPSPPLPRCHGPPGCPCALARWRRFTVS